MKRLIYREIAKGDQDLNYLELFENDYDHVFKVEIRSDSYRPQCYARISLWSSIGWLQVFELHPGRMKTEHGLCYRQAAGYEHFKLDRDELVRVAQEVLGDA